MSNGSNELLNNILTTTNEDSMQEALEDTKVSNCLGQGVKNCVYVQIFV